MRRICINQKCKSEKVSFIQNTVSGSHYVCNDCGRYKDKSEWELKEEIFRIILAVERGVISAQTGIDKIKEANK